MTEKTIQNAEIKERYERIIRETYDNNYEFNRWLKNERLRLDYVMTYKAINFHLQSVNFKSCLELGPGPGTWTRLLYRRNHVARFDLIDISEEMRNQFALEMRDLNSVNYYVTDFFNFEVNTSYDLFFSSRAVEYFEDAEKLMDKVTTSIKEGGAGVIVTKNPEHVTTHKLFGLGKKRKQHTGQIPAKKMRSFLEARNCKNIQFYPCIIRIPLLDRLSLRISEMIFEKTFQKPSDRISKLAESYVVVFSK